SDPCLPANGPRWAARDATGGPGSRRPGRTGAHMPCVVPTEPPPRAPRLDRGKEEYPMNLKKFAVLTAATSGLVLAGAGAAMADTSADGSATGSPGVVSGNNTQVPVHIPVNV